eukprot:jgi/Botrbrau1/5737/Bobra.0134s0011.1
MTPSDKMYMKALLTAALTVWCIGLVNANVIRLPTSNLSSPTGTGNVINETTLAFGRRMTSPTGIPDWDRALEIHNNLRASRGVGPLQWQNGLRQISDEHGQQLAWREQCNLRHIGLDPSRNDFGECLSGGGPVGSADYVALMTLGIQLWINEGPGGGHYNIMVNPDYKVLGCATQLGRDAGGPDCWVITCNYGF